MNVRIHVLCSTFTILLWTTIGSAQPVISAAGAGDPGGRGECVRNCIGEAKRLVAECVEAGGEQRECAARGREYARQCQRQCQGDGNCQERCAAQAREARAHCLKSGGSVQQCDARAATVLENCLTANCNPPGTCEDRCVHQAMEIHAACIDEGIDPEECALRARHFARTCIDEHCTPSCQERCRHEAEVVRRTCLANGGTNEQCAEAARSFMQACVAAHCTPPDCEDACTSRAVHLYRMCLESGGDEDDCAVRARTELAACIQENCPPADCPERCQRLARNVGHLCIEMGGSEEDCAARAQEALASCLSENCLICGTIAGIGCPEGQFCQFPPGTCQISDNAGVCRPIPQACPELYQPVCGCDGVTYDNACFAAAAQQSVAHAGPCREHCGGIAGLPCPEGQFCKFRPGECHISDNMGVCFPIPQGCPDVWDPVCGCDGTTYSNACDADAAGVSIAYEGECRSACGGIAGVVCEKGRFCKFPIGTCGDGDIQGVCQPFPQACPMIYAPVCGCDGKTYENLCMAAGAGASVRHEGPCHD